MFRKSTSFPRILTITLLHSCNAKLRQKILTVTSTKCMVCLFIYDSFIVFCLGENNRHTLKGFSDYLRHAAIEMTESVSQNQFEINTLRPRQNGSHFADDTCKRISLKGYVRILIKISPKFVPKSPIDNIPALFQIMAWRQPGNKPLSEAMMVSLLTHICVARPQWVYHHCNKI